MTTPSGLTFQIFNRATGRLVSIYEAKSGSLAYLTRALGKIQIYRTAAAAYDATAAPIDVELVPQLRPRPRFGEWAGRALGIASILSIVAGIYGEQRATERRQEFLGNLWNYDPDLANQLSTEWGYTV